MSEEINLLNCDKEPIHIPGRIQSHGFLLVCNSNSLDIKQVSVNISDYLNISYESLLNKNLDFILDDITIKNIQNSVINNDFSAFNPTQITLEGNTFNLIGSISENILILEIEPCLGNTNQHSKFINSFNSTLTQIQSAKTLTELFSVTAAKVKELINYDRVMIYRFDNQWNGEVVGEAKEENLEAYLGLHYPHTDIPSQARELYLKSWIRIITSINDAQPAIFPVINPDTNKPVDLSNTVLRATSPIHIEYLKNMGVEATLTISIIFQGKLWGLFACHHYSPKFVDYNIRMTCELIGKIFSNHLSYKKNDEDLKYISKINNNNVHLVEKMSKSSSIKEGLLDSKINLLDLNEAGGAAYCNKDNIFTLGNTPSKDQIKVILEFLNKQENNLFYTNELSLPLPEAKEFKETASGILSVKISTKEYIIWFKSEFIENVNWGGKPDEKHIVQENNTIRLSPRKSFEKWSQAVENKSTEWHKSEIEVAEKLRENIINIILKKSYEIEELNKELEYQKKSLILKNEEISNFAYIASHDLKEPLRMITVYNQMLLKRYKNQLDSDAEEFLNYSIDGTKRMKLLIDDLLQYATIGTEKKYLNEINLNDVITSVINNFKMLLDEKNVKLNCVQLPRIIGEPSLIYILFQNVISNAIKYNDKKEIIIDIKYQEQENYFEFQISDNGIGIESEDFEEIFMMFKRLHSKNEFEGSGIGLATCKKIVEYHQGKIWIESVISQGTTFHFTISKNLN